MRSAEVLLSRPPLKRLWCMSETEVKTAPPERAMFLVFRGVACVIVALSGRGGGGAWYWYCVKNSEDLRHIRARQHNTAPRGVSHLCTMTSPYNTSFAVLLLPTPCGKTARGSVLLSPFFFSLDV